MNLKVGDIVILRGNSYGINVFEKVKVLEVTKLTYLLGFLDGDYKERIGIENFDERYIIAEVVEN